MPNPTPDPTHDPVPYDRFLELVTQKNGIEQARNTLAADLDHLKQTGDTARAAAQQQLDAAQQQLSDLNRALAAEKQTALRLRVAVTKGLPAELAARLVGNDETELTADAERLAAFLKPTAPGVPPPSGGSASAVLDLARMTPAQIRQARAEGKIKLGG